MTRPAVVLLAMSSALAAVVVVALVGWLVGCGVPVEHLVAVAVLEMVGAGSMSYWSWTRHQRRLGWLLRIESTLADQPDLMVWLAERHSDGRLSLAWAYGEPLRTWRPTPYYEPKPDEVGPFTYWLDTWEDSSGLRDASIHHALDDGESTFWIAHSRGRMFKTKATPIDSRFVRCVSRDVTEEHRHGAAWGREEIVRAAAMLDAMKGPPHA